MGKIITIVGPHGVGKTALFQYARQKDDFLVFDGFKLVTSNESSFEDNQKRYFELIKEQNTKIINDRRDGFIIRSMEEILYFYELNNKEPAFYIPDNLFSDSIIYLDASLSILRKRCEIDANHDREEWYRKEYTKYDSFWKKKSNILIDTSFLNIGEVYEKIKEFVCD